MNNTLTGRRYIVFSLVAVMFIQLLPIATLLSPWRPILPIMIVAFWAYIAPSHVGSVFGFIYGLMIEATLGMEILQLALPCALVALVVQHVFMKLRTYSIFQQSFYIATLSLIAVSLALPLSSVVLNADLLALLGRSFIAAVVVWLVLAIWFEPLSRRYVVAREH